MKARNECGNVNIQRMKAFVARSNSIYPERVLDLYPAKPHADCDDYLGTDVDCENPSAGELTSPPVCGSTTTGDKELDTTQLYDTVAGWDGEVNQFSLKSDCKAVTRDEIASYIAYYNYAQTFDAFSPLNWTHYEQEALQVRYCQSCSSTSSTT